MVTSSFFNDIHLLTLLAPPQIRPPLLLSNNDPCPTGLTLLPVTHSYHTHSTVLPLLPALHLWVS